MRADADSELLPISLVAHHAFCPRRAWLEAAGESVDSYQMQVGTSSHARVDNPAARDADHIRALAVRDAGLGIVGRCDAIRREVDGSLIVIEHKATPVRKKPEVTEPMRLQLALQGLALAAMGEIVSGYEVWFSSHHVGKPVEISEDDQIAAVIAVGDTRETLASMTAPEPLPDDRRCMRCSHAGICLPEERALEPVPRRIQVPDPDTAVLHLATPGARAAIRQGRVVVTRGDDVNSVPIERVEALVVHGNCDLSSALIREALWRRLPIVWCSGTGRTIGWAVSAKSANGMARVRQHEQSAEGRLDLAREFVFAKVANQATLLRRNGSAPECVARLRQIQASCTTAESLEELLGYEGVAASVYFSGFPTMIAAGWVGFNRRIGRGATDPANVALNVAYGVLVAECVRALVSCGLDPHAGFLHSSNRNKPALALDLCEEFRPVVADSAVIRAFNNGELADHDFTDVLGSTRIRDGGRRAVIAAVEQRLTTRFRHPTFGYSVTWRRAIEIQARLVLGIIDGTQSRYVGVRVR